MAELKCRFIVLKTVAYQDRKKIVTAFSDQLGMFAFLIKGLSRKSPLLHSFCDCFSESEGVFQKKQSDLWSYIDGTSLTLHLPLREKPIYLQTAFSLSQTLSSMHVSEEASIPLYALLSAYLKQIPHFECHQTLIASFYLKLLKFEGYFVPRKDILGALADAQKFQDLKLLRISHEEYEEVMALFSKHMV